MTGVSTAFIEDIAGIGGLFGIAFTLEDSTPIANDDTPGPCEISPVEVICATDRNQPDKDEKYCDTENEFEVVIFHPIPPFYLYTT
jgi:hypothetical protein